MNRLLLTAVLATGLLAQASAHAAGVRDHTRLAGPGAAVSQSQAEELTLTLSETAVRPVQTWVRAAAALQAGAGNTLLADLPLSEAALVRIGQRVRAFPLESRSSMYQARIVGVSLQDGRAVIKASLPGQAHASGSGYLMEIVVDQGPFLSIPNEAIIEEGSKQVVYVAQSTGKYLPREVQTGIQGELFTQVLQGLEQGEMVVTVGSFFVDAEYKMKSGR